MKSTEKNKLKMLLCVFASMMTTEIFAETAPATATSTATIPVNTMLLGIAILLLCIIIVLAGTVSSAIELYKSGKIEDAKNGNATVKNIVLLLGFVFLSNVMFSQIQPARTVITNPPALESGLYFYAFTAIIIIEVLTILFFIRTLRFLTGIENLSKKEKVNKKRRSFWEMINQFKSIDEEHDMDTGHNYDGIRELDNVTPPWFTMGFAASIIFAIVYLYRYQVVHSAPSQLEEYAAEVNEAKSLQDSLLAHEGNKVDENTVAMLGAADIAAGKKLFGVNCMPCHGDKGQGVVGPNLTDDYWLHGGSVKDVFKTIKYGWVDKGMKSWKDDYSATQIAQLASFVKSLRGTNPPGAKEKQGELFDEKSSSVTVSVTGVKEDSVKSK